MHATINLIASTLSVIIFMCERCNTPITDLSCHANQIPNAAAAIKRRKAALLYHFIKLLLFWTTSGSHAHTQAEAQGRKNYAPSALAAAQTGCCRRGLLPGATEIPTYAPSDEYFLALSIVCIKMRVAHFNASFANKFFLEQSNQNFGPARA